MTKAEQARELEALRTENSVLRAQLEALRAQHAAELEARSAKPAAQDTLFTGGFAECGAWVRANPGKGRCVRPHGQAYAVFAR